MSPLEVAEAQYADRAQLARDMAAAGVQAWQQVNPADLMGSWLARLGRLMNTLRQAQYTAAATADSFTDRMLREQGMSSPSAGKVRTDAFAGVASDGRPLEMLLQGPVFATKAAIRKGATIERAMATGQATLSMTLRTQVADAGRVADGVAVAARESVGYVRMLVPPGDCSRCIVLAGKFYRYNAGFDRHPNCNCIHVPARGEEALQSEGLVSDPKALFDSLTEAEQNKAFTVNGARAIRDGADMNQVVNARRGANGMAPAGARITNAEKLAVQGGRAKLRTTTVFGQEVFITSEGTTRRGLAGQRLLSQGGKLRVENAETVNRNSKDGVVQRTVRRNRVQTPRLMPESIYQLAETREEAVRLLKRFGYIV